MLSRKKQKVNTARNPNIGVYGDVVIPGADPGFLERGGSLLFLNSLTGKIIAEKSNYRGVTTPITPPLNPPLDTTL